MNSAARRDTQHSAAEFLAAHYHPGAGILYPLGTAGGVLREAGIALREGLNEGNHPAWDAAQARPGMFLREEWAVAVPSDEVSGILRKAAQQGRSYRLRKRVTVKDSTIEVYHQE